MLTTSKNVYKATYTGNTPCACGRIRSVSPKGGTEGESPWWKGFVKQVNFKVSAKECGNYE